MAVILKEQALDIHLNPLLRALCKNELEFLCSTDDNQEECLKAAFLKKQIANRPCQEEIANLIQVSQADINVDPSLQQACALDLLKYCYEIPQGNGRRKLNERTKR